MANSNLKSLKKRSEQLRKQRLANAQQAASVVDALTADDAELARQQAELDAEIAAATPPAMAPINPDKLSLSVARALRQSTIARNLEHPDEGIRRISEAALTTGPQRGMSGRYRFELDGHQMEVCVYDLGPSDRARAQMARTVGDPTTLTAADPIVHVIRQASTRYQP